MAATLSTLTSNVTAPVDYVLMKGLLSSARKKLPFFNGTLPGELEKGKGSASVKWRRIENLAAVTTALSEINGTAAAFLGRDAVRPTYTDISATVAKYGNAILMTEEMDLYQVNSKSLDFVDTLGANAGESLNRLMEVVFSGATQVRYSDGAFGTTTDTLVTKPIQLNDIKYAVNQLNANSAMRFTSAGYGSQNVGTSPVRASFYGITGVDVEEDIRALTGFIPVEQYGGYTETMPFEFGSVAGVRFCSTEIIPITSGVAAISTTGYRGTTTALQNVYSTYIYGKEAVGSVALGNMHATTSYEMYDPKKPPAVELIIHPAGSSGIFDMYNEMGSIAWKTYHAGQILNSGWVTKVRSLSNKL